MIVSDHRSTPSRLAQSRATLSRNSVRAPSETGSNSGSSSSSSSSTTNVKVIARFRPHSNEELALGESNNSIVEFLSEESCNIETRDFSGSFTFDRVFDMNSTQEDVFNYSFKQTVDDLMKGYNGTIAAYGQTGSGKSYTMMGPNNSVDSPEYCGIIPRIVDRIFEMILNSSVDIDYTVKVSYMEIYMERIRDLLNPINDNLPIHENKARGVYVKGLTEEYVSTCDEVYEVMRQGSSVRAVASTNMNQESSRSHSIFVINVTQKNTVSGTQKISQLSLVDLAGSENVGKTGASGQTLEEAKKINKSLSALGMVINSLTDGKSSHIPYRDSKLTRILQESLGGNSRTSLIVNCSPSFYNDSETISTLRFGVRAKTIKNKAKINTELSPLELSQLVRKLQLQLENRIAYSNKLESEITSWRSGEPPSRDSWTSLGVPVTSSSLADTVRKPSYSASASTSSIFSSPSNGFQSRNGLKSKFSASETAIPRLSEQGEYPTGHSSGISSINPSDSSQHNSQIAQLEAENKILHERVEHLTRLCDDTKLEEMIFGGTSSPTIDSDIPSSASSASFPALDDDHPARKQINEYKSYISHLEKQLYLAEVQRTVSAPPQQLMFTNSGGNSGLPLPPANFDIGNTTLSGYSPTHSNASMSSLPVNGQWALAPPPTGPPPSTMPRSNSDQTYFYNEMIQDLKEEVEELRESNADKDRIITALRSINKRKENLNALSMNRTFDSSNLNHYSSTGLNSSSGSNIGAISEFSNSSNMLSGLTHSSSSYTSSSNLVSPSSNSSGVASNTTSPITSKFTSSPLAYTRNHFAPSTPTTTSRIAVAATNTQANGTSPSPSIQASYHRRFSTYEGTNFYGNGNIENMNGNNMVAKSNKDPSTDEDMLEHEGNGHVADRTLTNIPIN